MTSEASNKERQKDTVVVFTARSPQRIVREGGSQAWVVNPGRVRLCTWLVCAQNQHNPDHEFSDATEPHGCGFLIGRISGVRRSAEAADRYLIEISEFARINHPDLWDHKRNPVRFTSLEELGISIDDLRFQQLPVTSGQAETQTRVEALRGITFTEAKSALALTFGVKPEAVEITIRG